MYISSMSIRKKHRLLLFVPFVLSLLVTFGLNSCSSDNEDEAIRSIRGNWDVKEIYSAYGERKELGLAVSWDTTELVSDGFFNFSAEDKASFSYSRLDTVYASTNLDWVLTRERVNCGFTQCDVYYIDLEGKTFECQFGDQTDDAHIDAVLVRLIEETEVIGPYRQVIYTLEKS